MAPLSEWNMSRINRFCVAGIAVTNSKIVEQTNAVWMKRRMTSGGIKSTITHDYSYRAIESIKRRGWSNSRGRTIFRLMRWPNRGLLTTLSSGTKHISMTFVLQSHDLLCLFRHRTLRRNICLRGRGGAIFPSWKKLLLQVSFPNEFASMQMIIKIISRSNAHKT